jgi:apolipoprotein N-acyltransferase
MRLANTIVLAFGWQRVLIAFLAGAATTLALPPIEFWPAPFVTFSILVWLTDGAGAGRYGGLVSAALAGWWFGFGYFLSGVYWVGYAFLVEAEAFGWLLPFAVVGLPAYLALYTAFGMALARLIWPRGAVRVMALAFALTIGEWLRGHLLTGFPWNAFGYALMSPSWLAQGAALVGLWGMTFLAVAIYASPAVLADDVSDTRRPWLAPALGAVVVVLLAGYGGLRLARTPTDYVADVRLRLMQPNLPQDAKFRYDQKQPVMQRYLELSDRATGENATGVRDVTHLIWPESAFPFFLIREPDVLAQIAALLPPGTVLITGAIRPPEGATPGQPITRAYNSVYVIDHGGTVLSVYDKVHLVPFGEYLPFQATLERLGLMQLTRVRGGFIAGDRYRSLAVPRAPAMLPLVCYEIIFPGEAVPRGERPGWLLNLTNDGWFGLSAGPYQHFQQARIRAIEEGLPLVRVANTGISAVVDPLGRVIASLPLGAQGVIDARLPKPVPRTLYATAGEGPLLILLGVALVALLGAGRRRSPSQA